MHSSNPQPNELTHRSSGWTARALLAQGQTTPAAAALRVALGLGLCWLASYAAGGAGRVPPHWFYIPILLAAARFGLGGAAVTAAAAGILAGPFLPLDVATGTAQQFSDWTARAGFFMLIGLVMGAVIVRLRAALAREVELARTERDLAVRKASVIAAVSHEFRSPLTIIQGVTKTLDHHAMVDERGRPLLDSLSRAGERLSHLVGAVLAAAEGLEGQAQLDLKPVMLQEAVAGVVARLARLSGPSRVRLACESGAETVLSDPAILGRVLEEIIENALKFSPPQSDVDVGVHRLRDAVEIRVRDRGPGLSPEFLDRAFDAFSQQDQSTTREHDGLGLGLFDCRKLLERLEGRLELARHPEGGTEVVLHIPDFVVERTRIRLALPTL
jgi:signal transduction histidine kinase